MWGIVSYHPTILLTSPALFAIDMLGSRLAGRTLLMMHDDVDRIMYLLLTDETLPYVTSHLLRTTRDKIKSFLTYDGADEVRFCRIKEVICSKTTPYQQMEIVELCGYGKALILDGRLQSAVKDEYIYHETLVHPAMIMHPFPQKVLVLGGGEGATLREILKHSTLKRVVVVDIDREVVEACMKYLPEMHRGSYENPKSELIFANAAEYLESTSETFDVIFMDTTDPSEDGPSSGLFTAKFFTLLAERLTEKGIVAVQSGSTKLGSLDGFVSIHRALRSVFRNVMACSVFLPSFGEPWGFNFGCQSDENFSLDIKDIDQRIADRVQGILGFYDGITHVGIFSLPKYLRNELAKQGRLEGMAG